MVPHLATALTGPLLDLEEKILAATPAIERWFRLEWQEHTPPFYCSVDMRNAGYKLAPVDTNLFPGGFNHLATEMLPLSVQAAMAAIDKYCPDARNLLLIPEIAQRHPTYWQNVARLMQIFRQTGLHVRLGSLSPDVTQPTPIALPDGNMLVVEPLVRSANGRRVGLKDFDPCTILLNNDLSAGIPDILQNIHEQSLLPPLHAGWALTRHCWPVIRNALSSRSPFTKASWCPCWKSPSTARILHRAATSGRAISCGSATISITGAVCNRKGSETNASQIGRAHV